MSNNNKNQTTTVSSNANFTSSLYHWIKRKLVSRPVVVHSKNKPQTIPRDKSYKVKSKTDHTISTGWGIKFEYQI